MQTRLTYRLARKMALYAEKHSYRQTARKFGILDPYGQPSPGMVKLIINGYEPARPETRRRLGLPAEIRYPAQRRSWSERLAEDPISELPPWLLKWAFENRRDYGQL